MAWNWSSVDWGSVANAAASYYSADKAAGAAKDAGKIAAQGSDQATALQREIYQDQRNLNMPFYNGGLQAYDQYRALMGLGGSPSTGAGGTGGQTAQQQLVSHDAKGVPTPNAQLYASDPAYKQAWDSVAQQHQGQWRTGYWNGSDPNWIESNLRGKLPVGWGSTPTAGAGQTTQNPQQAQQAAFAAFRNTPGYQFGLNEGQKQLQSSASASGGLFSGKAGKALVQFGQNYADQQGYTPYMNRLAGLFGARRPLADRSAARARTSPIRRVQTCRMPPTREPPDCSANRRRRHGASDRRAGSSMTPMATTSREAANGVA
jgi:hypothetical protein